MYIGFVVSVYLMSRTVPPLLTLPYLVSTCSMVTFPLSNSQCDTVQNTSVHKMVAKLIFQYKWLEWQEYCAVAALLYVVRVSGGADNFL
jgi:hypothetical protein